MAEEYYIRNSEEEEARGPFSIDKLNTLAEANQVSTETLYYDDATEQWVAIGSNEGLRNRIWPEKRKLALRPKGRGDMDMLNAAADADESAKVSVTDMLAAAEGDTPETRHLKRKARLQHKAAALSVPGLGLIMLVSAFNNIYPNWPAISTVFANENGAEGFALYAPLFQHPFVFVGFLDLLLAVFLFLSVTEIFPLLRFRAMLGLGYLGFLHYAQWYNGDESAFFLMLCAVAGSLGIWVCTLTLNFMIMVLFLLIGLAGMLGYGYLVLTGGG